MIQPDRTIAAAAVKLSVQSFPSPDWDPFVDSIPGRSVYFRSGWTALANEVFGHDVFFIEARGESDELAGVLPLVRQRGLLGNFATSIPFFNYGGVLAASPEVASILMDRAKQLAFDLGCSYLELRDVEVRDPSWRVRKDKVSMVLDLPATVDELSKRLGSKLRSQIKRADRESVSVRSGGLELVADFYSVFAHNMRDLGTPVYPRRFFEAVIRRFADDVCLLVVDRAGKSAAAAFLVLEGGRAEIPWAACLAQAKPLGINMKLYWEALRLAIQRGCTSFDFGRSTVDSGTYRFKQQWGARPVQLYWHRWERNPSTAAPDDAGEHGRLMSYAVAIWQRLPLPVANVLGPLVSPSLPW
jgi:serine/alanine adding enzyme